MLKFAVNPRNKYNSLKIIQWNGQSVRARKQHLMNYLHSEAVDIAVLSETWFRHSDRISFPGYALERLDRNDKYGGIAILVSRALPYTPISFRNITYNRGIEVCGVHLTTLNLNIVSVYKSPKIRTSRTDWYNIISPFADRTVIAGDFNAHHRIWGSGRDDDLGNVLVDLLEDQNFSIMNDGTPTRIRRPVQNPSAVDISLVTTDLIAKSTWSVAQENLGSDHYVIQLIINETWVPKIIRPSSKWKEEKADWSQYQTKVNEKLLESYRCSNNKEKLTLLRNTVSSSADCAMPTKKPFTPVCRRPLWWDSQCSDVNSQRQLALRRYKQESNYENYFAYKEAEACAKRIFKQKSRDSWRTFISKLNRNSSPTFIWNTMKRIVNKNYQASPGHLSPELIEKIMVQLCPPFVPNNRPNLQLQRNHVPIVESSSQHLSNSFLESPFSTADMESALSDNRKSAPGFDFITYSLLKKLPRSGKTLLLDIYNSWWIGEEFLTDFKKIIVTLILKPGKDGTIPTSYRPISMLSCITKTFEHLIKARLEWHLEHFNLLPPTQYGFRKGHGTADAISHFVTDIQCSLSKNKYLACIFVDFKGAYDCVSLDILTSKLQSLKISRRVATGIVELYRDREIFIRDHQGQLHGPRLTSQGLPQGSKMSPILFNVYTADLHGMWDDSVSCIQYADDMCIYAVRDTYAESLGALRHIMYCLKVWTSDNNFTISPEKSAVMVFTRHRIPKVSEVTLAGITIPVVTRYKYLGLVLDSKLLWSQHILHVKEKCDRGINMLKFVSKRKYGATPAIALMFYRAYIRSIIDYGCVFYGNSAKSNLSILDRVQYKALRICTGSMRSSPIQAILSETQELPLRLRRLQLSINFLIKLQFFSRVDNLEKICSLTTECLTENYWMKKSNPILVDAFLESKELGYTDSKHLPFAHSEYRIIFSKLKVVFPDFRDSPDYNMQLARSVFSGFVNDICIFTDGSKIGSGVGGAYYVPGYEFSHKFKLNSLCSVYTAEAYAIEEALGWALQYATSNVAVFSDSMSVLHAIAGEGLYRQPVIFSIRRKVVELKNRHIETTFVWIKAHCGITNNEIVDQLAKAAASSDSTIGQVFSPYDIKSAFKQIISSKWSSEYIISVESSKNPYFLIHPTPAKPQAYMHLSKNFAATITRMKMNHGCFPAHLSKIGLRQNSFCGCDNSSVGDLNHMFFACPMKDAHRVGLMEFLKKYFHLPINITAVLASDNIQAYRSLIVFLKESEASI